MAKTNALDAVIFMLETMALIPSAPNKISTSELIQKLQQRNFVVDARKMQRILSALDEHYENLVCDNRGKPYGWQWQKGTRPLTVPGLTLDQALTLKLAERVLPGALPESIANAITPYYAAATDTLRRELSRRKVAQWPSKIEFSSAAFELQPMQIDAKVMQRINEALIEEKWLTIRYRNANDHVGDYRVKPLGLIIERPRTYLVAQLEKAKDENVPRTLLMSRIERATVDDECFTYPSGFNLSKFVSTQPSGFGDGKEINITLSIVPALARILRETPISKDQHLTPGKEADDEWTLTAAVYESERLIWWIRSLGPDAEVIAPPTIRERMQDDAREVVSYYEE